MNVEFQRIARRDKKASSVINAKKKRKAIEWERLEISSRKLDIPREHFMQTGSIKDRNGMDLQKQKVLKIGGKNTQKNYIKKIFMTQIATMVWLLT